MYIEGPYVISAYLFNFSLPLFICIFFYTHFCIPSYFPLFSQLPSFALHNPTSPYFHSSFLFSSKMATADGSRTIVFISLSLNFDFPISRWNQWISILLVSWYLHRWILILIPPVGCQNQSSCLTVSLYLHCWTLYFLLK